MTDPTMVCRRFAYRYGLEFVADGEIGLGRPCVGFTKGRRYVDINPHSATDYEPLWPADRRLLAPDGVDAYHKYSCLAVLVHVDRYDVAIEQLARWVTALVAGGGLETVAFWTGADGWQAIMTGVIGVALRYVPEPGWVEPAAVAGRPCTSATCEDVASARIVSWPTLPADEFPCYCTRCAAGVRTVLETMGHKYQAEPLDVHYIGAPARAVAPDGGVR